jgi:hypothetical protein
MLQYKTSCAGRWPQLVHLADAARSGFKEVRSEVLTIVSDRWMISAVLIGGVNLPVVKIHVSSSSPRVSLVAALHAIAALHRSCSAPCEPSSCPLPKRAVRC